MLRELKKHLTISNTIIIFILLMCEYIIFTTPGTILITISNELLLLLIVPMTLGFVILLIQR